MDIKEIELDGIVYNVKDTSKQPIISDLEEIRQNAKTAVQTIATYGNIVTHNTNEFATAEQGSTADSALQPADVINDVIHDDTQKPLSANMGKELYTEIQTLKARGRFLSLWNSGTGLPQTEPATIPYEYKTGDYFVVGTISSSGTNYKPVGTVYEGSASTTPETQVVAVDDTYFFDGTTWHLQANAKRSVSFEELTGSPYDNTNLSTALNSKVAANSEITGATKTKITYDSKGLVTGGEDLQASDIPNLTLSKISDVTATATELNVLDGITATTTELNYVDGVTSNIQTQLNNKVASNSAITGATKTKITYDSKGLVTGGADLEASDIPNLTLSKISDVTATASEVNVLDGITATTTELNYVDGVTSNIQTQLNKKLNTSDVIDNVTTTTTNQALSANMGKSLQDQIDNLKQRGRYLSIWNCSTGLATTTPTTNPYTYKSGDYFVVGIVGSTNYRPVGATYNKDVPSTTVETGTVIPNDTYYYDGTNWSLLHTEQPTVAFSTLAGDPYDNTNLTTALNAKVTGNSAITGATKTKITYDSKGLVTAGADLEASDIPNLNLTKITDVTATASELNVLDGITATTTELNYVDGVTSSIQTQLNNRALSGDIKNGTLTIQRNSTTVKTFSANQDTDETVNIEVPTAAGDISYTNPDYPTVAAALDKLLYVKPSVSISGGNSYEYGKTVNSVSLSWTWNKAITSQSLNQGIGTLANDVRSYTYSTPINSNKTFTISGGDGTNTASASTSVNFYYKRYWGVSTNAAITDSEILNLSQELTSGRAQSRNFDCSGGKYFYLVIPTTYCTGIKFKVGGLAFSDMNVVTRTITNASGGSVSYNIYRPNNIQTGSAIAVEVS